MANKATFEAIQHEISNLNIGEYMKFCKDFGIECNKVKIAEVFKKISNNSKELFFEDFKSTLWRIFETRDLEDIDKLKKRLKEIRKINKNKSKPEIEKPPLPKNKDLQEINKPQHEPKEHISQQEIQEKLENPVIEQNIEQNKEQFEEKVISRPKGGDPK